MTNTPQEPIPADVAAEMGALSDTVEKMPPTPPEEIEARLAAVKTAGPASAWDVEYMAKCDAVIDKIIADGLEDLADGIHPHTIWRDTFDALELGDHHRGPSSNRMHGIAAQAIMRLMLRAFEDGQGWQRVKALTIMPDLGSYEGPKLFEAFTPVGAISQKHSRHHAMMDTYMAYKIAVSKDEAGNTGFELTIRGTLLPDTNGLFLHNEIV